jgi:hypothetical protein
MPEDGLVGLVFNGESGSGGMADDSDYSNRVLLESFVGIADGSNDLMLEVSYSTDIVDNGKICNIIKKSINRDVAAQGVLFRRPKTLFPDEFPFFCLYFFEFRSAPESGYLDNLSPLKKDLNQSESTSNNPAVFKESIDLMGVRIGGHVKVFRDLSEEEISNTSTNEISEEPVSVKAVEDF